jgi:hypothetical protein
VYRRGRSREDRATVGHGSRGVTGTVEAATDPENAAKSRNRSAGSSSESVPARSRVGPGQLRPFPGRPRLGSAREKWQGAGSTLAHDGPPIEPVVAEGRRRRPMGPKATRDVLLNLDEQRTRTQARLPTCVEGVDPPLVRGGGADKPELA